METLPHMNTHGTHTHTHTHLEAFFFFFFSPPFISLSSKLKQDNLSATCDFLVFDIALPRGCGYGVISSTEGKQTWLQQTGTYIKSDSSDLMPLHSARSGKSVAKSLSGSFRGSRIHRQGAYQLKKKKYTASINSSPLGTLLFRGWSLFSYGTL